MTHGRRKFATVCGRRADGGRVALLRGAHGRALSRCPPVIVGSVYGWRLTPARFFRQQSMGLDTAFRTKARSLQLKPAVLSVSCVTEQLYEKDRLLGFGLSQGQATAVQQLFHARRQIVLSESAKTKKKVPSSTRCAPQSHATPLATLLSLSSVVSTQFLSFFPSLAVALPRSPPIPPLANCSDP